MQLVFIKAWRRLKNITGMELDQELMNIKKQWDEHDQGILQWNDMNTVKQSVPNSAIVSSALGIGQMQIWVNESTNNLTFQVKYSTGVVKNATVALS